MSILFIDIEKLDIHPFALLAPQATEREFLALLTDIAQSGIKHPLIVIKREEKFLIIDGVHRYKAAKYLGFKKVPAIIKKLTEEEIYDFVFMTATCRRNLNEDQKAALAVNLLPECPSELEIKKIALRTGSKSSKVKKLLQLKKEDAELFQKILNGELLYEDIKKIKSLERKRGLIPELENLNLSERLKKILSSLPASIQEIFLEEIKNLSDIEEKKNFSLTELEQIIKEIRKEETKDLSIIENEVSNLIKSEIKNKNTIKLLKKREKFLKGLCAKLYVALKEYTESSKEEDSEVNKIPLQVDITELVETLDSSLVKIKKIKQYLAQSQNISDEDFTTSDPNRIKKELKLERSLQNILLGFEETNVSNILVLIKQGIVSQKNQKTLSILLDRIEDFLYSLQEILFNEIIKNSPESQGNNIFIIENYDENS